MQITCIHNRGKYNFHLNPLYESANSCETNSASRLVSSKERRLAPFQSRFLSSPRSVILPIAAGEQRFSVTRIEDASSQGGWRRVVQDGNRVGVKVKLKNQDGNSNSDRFHLRLNIVLVFFFKYILGRARWIKRACKTIIRYDRFQFFFVIFFFFY